MEVWREWLPPPVAEEARAVEGGRFGTLFRGLREEWARNEALGSAARSQATLKWVSLVNRCGRRPGDAAQLLIGSHPCGLCLLQPKPPSAVEPVAAGMLFPIPGCDQKRAISRP